MADSIKTDLKPTGFQGISTLHRGKVPVTRPVSAVPKGVAHVSFLGGGVFVPARNSDDRRMLVELVVDRAHTKGQLQVLVGDQRWIVDGSADPSDRVCSRCGAAVEVACYSPTTGNIGDCMQCALGAADPEGHHAGSRRRARRGH